jgi:hypothetical protein
MRTPLTLPAKTIIRASQFPRRFERHDEHPLALLALILELAASVGLVERGAIAAFGVLESGPDGPSPGLRKHLALQTRLTIAFSGGQA